MGVERAPGVLVRVVDDAGIIAPPSFERYPVVIGEGDPYKLISDQQMSRTSGTVDPIPSGTTVNEIVTVGDLPGVAKYVEGVDYVLGGTNIISWIGSRKPTLGSNYYMSFTETRAASAYTPYLYFDENLVYADHGSATRTNGNINDVSKGASLAFLNGATGVIVAQLNLSAATDPDAPTSQELETAFEAMRGELQKITDYKLYLLPMSSGTLYTTTAADIFFNHAVIMSMYTRKQERACVAAMPMGTTRDGFANFALSYAHERMVVPATYGGISKVNGFTSNYDTRFYNCAVMGKFCAQPIGINISDEIIAGVTVTDNWTPDEHDFLVKRGVSPAKIKGTVVRNIMLATSNTASALTHDLGVQDVKDYVKKYWREGIWEAYRNKPITRELLGQMTDSSKSMLQQLVKDTVLSEYRRVTVAQDVTEPRKVNMYAQVKPAYGLQWVDVTFVFVLNFTT